MSEYAKKNVNVTCISSWNDTHVEEEVKALKCEDSVGMYAVT